MKFISGPMLCADKDKLYSYAYYLAVITILYNLIEGAVSVFFGLSDETLSLFGFGVDSFVEVMSGIGIYHMIARMKLYGDEKADLFERQALKITGVAFYILSAGLLFTGVFNLISEHRPETTFWGIIVSVISIITMQILITYKMEVGKALNSEAIIADARCTRSCLYLSVILLISSLGYEVFKIGIIDSAGALVIAYFSFNEGKESFEKSKGILCGCSDNNCKSAGTH